MKQQWKLMSGGLTAVLGLALPGAVLSASRAEAQAQAYPRPRVTTRSRATTPGPSATVQPRANPQPGPVPSAGTDPGTSTTAQSATDAQLRTDVQALAAERSRFTVRGMLTDMEEMDPREVELDLDRYQVVPVQDVLDINRVGRLTRLVDVDSTARRNQNLLTALLRRSRRISTELTVVGADLNRRLLFVTDSRTVGPGVPIYYP